LPGLDPGIHVLATAVVDAAEDVGGRVKPGHGGKSSAAFGNFAGLSQLPLGEERYNP
jgi:hypothetical protein